MAWLGPLTGIVDGKNKTVSPQAHRSGCLFRRIFWDQEMNGGDASAAAGMLWSLRDLKKGI
jgi:hypothetical protein